MNGVAQRLVLTQRQNDTWKWPIEVGDMVKRHSKMNTVNPLLTNLQYKLIKLFSLMNSSKEQWKL